jgi:hypothetical protein
LAYRNLEISLSVGNVCSPALFFFYKSLGIAICPGSHVCERPTYHDEEFLERLQEEFEDNVTLSEEWNDDFDEYYMFEFNRCIVATSSAGDGLLYNAELYHRGRAHSDPNAPKRAAMFLTFSESLVDADDTRTLPLGQQHVIGWNLWGHTIDEFSTIGKNKWRFWHSLGLFLPEHSKDIYRPWNMLDSLALIFREHDEEPYMLGNGVIGFSMFHWGVEKLLMATVSMAMVYLLSIALSSCFARAGKRSCLVVEKSCSKQRPL